MKTPTQILIVAALVFAPLVALASDCRPPRAWVDRNEPAEEYDARIDKLFELTASLHRVDRAGLRAISYGESRWAKYVLFDCTWRPDDAGGNCSGGQARSYFQLEISACPELFERPKGDGTEETLRVATKCALQRWQYARRACPTIEGAFAKYGGRECSDTTESTAFKAYWFGRFGGHK
jgi:hypothetical protein